MTCVPLRLDTNTERFVQPNVGPLLVSVGMLPIGMLTLGLPVLLCFWQKRHSIFISESLSCDGERRLQHCLLCALQSHERLCHNLYQISVCDASRR